MFAWPFFKEASVSCASSTRSMCSCSFSPFIGKALGACPSTGCPCRLVVLDHHLDALQGVGEQEENSSTTRCSRCGSEQGESAPEYLASSSSSGSSSTSESRSSYMEDSGHSSAADFRTP